MDNTVDKAVEVDSTSQNSRNDIGEQSAGVLSRVWLPGFHRV